MVKIRTIERVICGKVKERFLLKSAESQAVNFLFVHNKPGQSSDISICVIATNKANIKVNATVKIEKTAPQTNTYLSIKAFSEAGATIEASPNLEINNNLVSAGHSLTTRYIDKEELFYLTSRGISKSVAKKIIIDGLIKPYKDGVIL